MNHLTLTITALIAVTTHTHAQYSTINESKAFGYAANAGWLNFRPTAADGVQVFEYSLSGKVYGANIGWINLGNGSINQYSNANSTDYGVNHDGTGKLFGYAYSGNIGWIHFGSLSDSTPNRPRFDLATGIFSGYAWSGNIGWINLGTSRLKTDLVQRPDTDGDGIGDAWELAYTGTLTTLAPNADSDGDGRSNLQEYLADTNPLLADAAPSLRILSTARDASGDTTSHLQFDARATRSYVLQESTELASGTWRNRETVLGLGQLLNLYPDSRGPRNFYRLDVKPPTTMIP
jgi:Bacterial TSP3 repeat